MQNEIWRNRIALRIDIDFACDLRKGVPYLLDALGQHGMKATFFVAAGGRTGGHVLSRLLRRGYWTRYRRLGLWRIVTKMGIAAIGSAGDRLVRSRDILLRIPAEGHELGLHGFDHAWWAERVWSASDAEVEAELARAYGAFRSVTEADGLAWASPNWRTTDGVLGLLQRRKVPYLSECWGQGPFVTVTSAGREIPVPHLPITLPCLEALRIARDLRPHEAVSAVLDGRPADRYDLVCMHGYYEGLMERGAFRLFLEACRRQGLETLTLRQTAELITGQRISLPRCRLTRGPLPGFVGDVSRQEEPSHGQ